MSDFIACWEPASFEAGAWHVVNGRYALPRGYRGTRMGEGMGFQPIMDTSVRDMAPQPRDNRAAALDTSGERQIISYRRIGGGSKVKSQSGLSRADRVHNRRTRKQRARIERNVHRPVNTGIVPDDVGTTVRERDEQRAKQARRRRELCALAQQRLSELRAELRVLGERAQTASADELRTLRATAKGLKKKINYTKRELRDVYGVSVPSA